MWTKPWRLTEGFIIGAGLIAAGMMLELSTGSVDWDAFAWPVNGIVLACFTAIVVAMALAAPKVYAFRFLGSHAAAVPAIVYAVALTIVMGLTRQTTDGRGSRSGPSCSSMSTWPLSSAWWW